LTAKYKGAYRPRPRSISTWKAKKFVVCPFYEQMGATRGATALTLWPKRPFPCRNLDLRYVRACPQTPQLPGLVFDPTGTTSVVAGVAGGRARHPRAVAHPQERRGGGCGASGDRWWTQDRVWMAPTDPGIDQNVRGTGGRFVDTLLGPTSALYPHLMRRSRSRKQAGRIDLLVDVRQGGLKVAGRYRGHPASSDA